MTKITSLCVYCGTSSRSAASHRAAAARLGTLLAARGIGLVYGGGCIGLMGVLADAALAGGGRVVGIIPYRLKEHEIGHDGLTELVVVDSMHERKRRMFELADAFAILPGGLGTLDEAVEIIAWKQLGLHDKPIVLVDIDGYWAPFRTLIEAVVAGDYARPEIADLFTTVESVEAMFQALAAAPEPALSPEPERL
ncbi:MAG: TIGR00730 family Rossman fold protein [Alphaproteobacteria bacterium]